jgi:hypothetical protein
MNTRQFVDSRSTVRREAMQVAILVMTLIVARSTFAQTTFGTLSNFDVFNDTGTDCHGFEIELDGISADKVVYTFGGTYERYGNPTVTNFAGGTFVRYESPWDAVNLKFTEATPQAPAVITPTNGHACWTGGSGNYATAGCEHFGMTLSAQPTNTVYRWLVADPQHPGNLQPSGTKVTIPAPTWTVTPQPAAPPLVQAAIPAVPYDAVGQQFGDAIWVKVFETKAPNPAELNHLVTDDPAVPESPAQVEMEWALLQTGPGALNELAIEKQAAADSESVTRRYEFYKYTGAYVLESHEALCIDPNCAVPDPSELGNYVGAQIGAVNLAGLATTTTTSTTITSTTISTTSTTTSTTLAPCGPVTGAALTLSKILPPPGDDGLMFKGTFPLVPPVAPMLASASNGIGVRLIDQATVVLDVQVPPGAFDQATKVGWKVNKKATQWTFVGPKTGAVGGITKVVLTDKSAKTPGVVAFSIVGKAGTFAAGPHVTADVVLLASEACFEVAFPATPPATPSCVLNKTKTTLKCK